MINNVDQNKLNSELRSANIDLQVTIHDPISFKSYEECDKWCIGILDNSGDRVKVYNKHACFRFAGRPGNYDATVEPQLDEFDTELYLLPILKDNKYDILPDVIFETSTYIGVEWLDKHDSWRPATTEDFVFSVGTGASTPTNTFKELAKKISQLQVDSTSMCDFDDKKRLRWQGYCTNINVHGCLFDDDIPGESLSVESVREHIENNKLVPGLMLSNLSTDDFIVNRTTGKVRLLGIDGFAFLYTPNNNYVIEPLYEQSHIAVEPPSVSYDSGVVNYYFHGQWKSFSI